VLRLTAGNINDISIARALLERAGLISRPARRSRLRRQPPAPLPRRPNRPKRSFPRSLPAADQSPTTPSPTETETALSACGAASRTGAALPPDTTSWPDTSSAPPTSPPSSPAGSIETEAAPSSWMLQSIGDEWPRRPKTQKRPLYRPRAPLLIDLGLSVVTSPSLGLSCAVRTRSTPTCRDPRVLAPSLVESQRRCIQLAAMLCSLQEMS
jgi:hypothetical protein